MYLTECTYRRKSDTREGIQLHCILKRVNCSENECRECKFTEVIRTAETMDVWRHRRKQWSPGQPSQGVGDTVTKVTKVTGIARGVAVVAEMFGFDCGCDKRRKLLNKLFPYNK